MASATPEDDAEGADPAPPPVLQTQAEAEAQDLMLVASARGWSLDEARAQRVAADEVGRISALVAERYPDSFVGSVLGDNPTDPPALYVKGMANDFIRSLVDESSVAIDLRDEQPFSFDELETRKLAVHEVLEGMGFDTVSTGFSVDEAGVIRAGVVRATGDNRATDLASAEQVVANLPPDLQGDVRLVVNDRPIAIDENGAWGGMWVRDDGANECTSGWSVKNSNGTTGVSTAGHCEGINQISHPGVGVHTFPFVAEHRGAWGDVEWHTSPVDDYAMFYASATDLREVNAVEPRAAITQGEAICQYGRASNDRDCGLTVQQVSQACTNDGVFNNRLVLMSGDTGIGGDSGGPWSFGTTAYGGHKGNCADVPGREVFSVAALFDEAIGVTLLTK